jgi:hypothetical protein
MAQTGTDRSAWAHDAARFAGHGSRSRLQTVYTVLTRDLSVVQREEIDSLLVAASPDAESAARSRLEQFKAVARKESPESFLALLDQLNDVRSLGLTGWPALTDIHPATRRLLVDWAYRYSIWNLRRFSAAKREAIVICFLQAARAEMTDGIVEMQDKLITSIHNKARKRYEDLLSATEEARSRAVEVLEEMGTVVFWLLKGQANDLLNAPDPQTLTGKRDRAIWPCSSAAACAAPSSSASRSKISSSARGGGCCWT